jgi:hypothetical protein
MTFSLVFSRSGESPSGRSPGRWALWCVNANADTRKVVHRGTGRTIVWWRVKYGKRSRKTPANGYLSRVGRRGDGSRQRAPRPWTPPAGDGPAGGAVAAYREALKEDTRERVPLDWAAAQMDLGSALANLGARESGTARLEEAVSAYRAALTVYSRERVPLNWANGQRGLGSALLDLGGRESGTGRLERAVAAYREALNEQTRERVPLEWARTLNSPGYALTVLGEREGGTARLEEAVAALRESLKERLRERVPVDWSGDPKQPRRCALGLGHACERDRAA